MRIYLLVSSPSSSSSSSSSPCIEINGRQWTLQPFDTESSTTNPITYSCISYTWGSGREPNPLNPSSPLLVSDRTLPALQTLIRHQPSCSAIWIDAFCIPVTEPERTQSLESMGYIYARSEEVIIVLSAAAFPALNHMLASFKFDINDLAVLEREEWVERAWTYQETVNSKALLFTCEGEESVLVPDQRFFDCVGYALNRLQLSMVQKLRVYPKLNAFEDVMAEIYTSAYQGRAALAVMSNMDRRVQARAEDHFYAMIGAITAEKAEKSGDTLPCEAFMRLCERKGDFSFIFSASKRDERPARGWRPATSDDMPSILPWHTWGTSQPGRLCDEGLWLDDMLPVEQAVEPSEKTTLFLQKWLTGFWRDEGVPSGTLQEAVYTTLQAMGFTGSSSYLITDEGYFFPFEPVAREQLSQILISTDLRWTIGAPGIVSYKEGNTKRILYTMGAFIGKAEKKDTISICIG